MIRVKFQDTVCPGVTNSDLYSAYTLCQFITHSTEHTIDSRRLERPLSELGHGEGATLVEYPSCCGPETSS